MNITKIVVKRFKAIDYVEYEPKSINVLIGENSSGKSSFLQAIQFAVSVVQAVYANANRKKYKNDRLSATLSFNELNYSPAKIVTTIAHGYGNLAQSAKKQVEIEFYADGVPNLHSSIQIRLGKNSNLSVSLFGEEMCDYIAATSHQFSMYVPGLAGVPFDESYQASGAVRRAAAKGDANTILRNILLLLQESADGWEPFINDINLFFPNTTITVNGHLDENGILEVLVDNNGIKKSIETIGTGLLQVIQIAAYINYFKPDLLLLDEPDSHLHPSNQVLLGKIVENYSNDNRSIFVATHSRHLLSALREKAKVSFFSHGKNTSFESEYQILFELGALDKFDIYRDPNTKYVVLVEDIKQDSIERIKTILDASGFEENSFIVQSYSSSSQVPSTLFVASCLEILRRDLLLIVHSDRDGRTDDEISDFIAKFATHNNIRVFVTKYSDTECYFCTQDHIERVLQLNGILDSEASAEAVINDAIVATQQSCLEKHLNRYLDKIREGRGRESERRRAYFESNIMKCMNGHILSGEVISIIHQRYHLNKESLFVSTAALADENLQAIKQEAVTNL